MKIVLQINTTVNTCSPGRIAEEIGQIAMEMGWKSYIAFGRKLATSQSELIHIGSDWDLKLHGLETRLFDRHGLGSRSATRKLIDQIKLIKPDVIHLHNIHGYYLNYPLLFTFLLESKIPIVWTLHDCWSLTGHCTHFDFSGCDRWKTGCHDCFLTKTYPNSILVDRSKQNWIDKSRYFLSIPNLTLVPVSNWLAGIVRQSFFKDIDLEMIHNGIDLQQFAPKNKQDILSKYNLNNECTILLGVASVWSHTKGLDDFKKLQTMLPPSTLLILVGLSEKQKRSLPKGILGVIRTESVEELSEFYAVADLFLNLTYEDTFPTTNLESIACGTPVLTYRTGGSEEAVTDDTGFIVEKGDLKAVLDVIHHIKRVGKAQYTAACRKRAVDHYNKADRYKEYVELYEQLLKKGSNES